MASTTNSPARRGDSTCLNYDFEETLALIASLALEDINDVQSRRKGKAKSGAPLTDEEVAFQLFAEEANSLISFSHDAILARSVDSALRSDRSLLREFAAMEVAATRDRQFAVALAEGRPPPTASSPSSRYLPGFPSRTSSITKPISVITTDSEDDDLLTLTKDSESYSKARLPPPPYPAARAPLKTFNECVICTDKITGQEVRAPCGHFYDIPCLIDLFNASTTDESLFPPRCCNKAFDFQQVRHHLGSKLALAFQSKSAEFSTTNRIYCHRPTCSMFLGAATDKAIAKFCDKCMAVTCGQCKEQAHPNLPCSAELDAVVLDLAEREGWKRCPGCHRLVELSHGCYHMTCHCRKQFCYVCTETWKTCRCPLWEETRLLTTAQDRVNRQVQAENPANNPFGSVFQRVVARQVDELRENNECMHYHWKYRPGAGRCDHCDRYLPQFLVRCSGCQTLACVRCRRNRL